jgi:ParE toxin of type II toxin-antitoxin system, parDE
MKVIFHPEASDEMFESARFFDEKCAGLGSDLITAIQESTRRILQFPESGPIEKWNIRKCLVRGFPFTLLYEATSDHIFIVAVMHQHRRPGFWARRLK